jgi:ubiquinone/menaquinone biosynthesis C-methylase UbiE
MSFKDAVVNHENVPPDYYESSIRTNLGQRFWHHSRFNETLKYIMKDENSRLLDIGSADGTFTSILVNKIKPKKLVGVDVLKASVDYANKKFKKERSVSFLLADAHELPFKQEMFDGVFALEVLEHVFEPKKVLSEIRRVLIPGGYVIGVPNEESSCLK